MCSQLVEHLSAETTATNDNKRETDYKREKGFDEADTVMLPINSTGKQSTVELN